jgi:hypothetical protein
MYKINILDNNKKVISKQEGNVRTSFMEDLANIDYQAYLTWVAEGNEAEEWSAE